MSTIRLLQITLRTIKFVFFLKIFGIILFHLHQKWNPKTFILFHQMKTFNNHASHCSVSEYKLTKDGVRASTAVTSFVRLLPLYKKIIPGFECSICVEYCWGARYQPLPGFLRWARAIFGPMTTHCSSLMSRKLLSIERRVGRIYVVSLLSLVFTLFPNHFACFM